jgi:hypothetical protein
MNITKDEKFPDKIKEGMSRLNHNWEIKILGIDKNGVKVENL